MTGYLKSLTGMMLIITFFTAISCTMGGKIQKIPMKIYNVINIPDGEFLHYGSYSLGEREGDYYFVTKKVASVDGGIYYRIYFNLITTEENQQKPDSYLKWPAYFTIDPKLGSVIESEGNLTPENSKNWVKGGGLIYWHYKLQREKGEVEYTSKLLKGNVTNESRYHVKVNTSIPSMSMWSGTGFIPRFLDIQRGGIYLTILPEIMKEPMIISWKFLSKETIRTKAGSFNVSEFSYALADPFLNRLMGAFLKGSTAMVEDSDRRLTIRSSLAGGEIVLEDISNINMK